MLPLGKNYVVLSENSGNILKKNTFKTIPLHLRYKDKHFTN